MLDFLMISTRSRQRGVVEIYPKFIIRPSNDLMIRGGDFYAIWDEERGLWSTDEHDVVRLVDKELDIFAKENSHKFDAHVKILYMWDAENGMIDSWHKYCQKRLRDAYTMLDEKLLFSNSETNKKDYASKRLPYPLEAGDISSWDKLISTLYSEEERHKIEWAIGAIVSGESKKLQKFIVLYGEGGTGKSTILNVIQQLFEGYYAVFDAKALGSSGHQFALEAFKKNPLVAIQHDGDLSRIEDNTRLNSLISHEEMLVNEKHKGQYAANFKCFLFLGSNKPVKITDARSGIIRRLIDVSPTGNKLSLRDYNSIVKKVGFELGAIAHHCKEVFMSDPTYYEGYIPIAMLGASNDFYNFVLDSYHIFIKEDGTTLKAAWAMYNEYCEDAKVPYPLSQRNFKEELKTYFRDFSDRFSLEDGSRVRSYYSGFRTEKFEDSKSKKKEDKHTPKLIDFREQESIFDKECADCPAQYATKKETPSNKWDEVMSKLSDIDTSELHYVKVPENHIVIDFDIPDKNGNKWFEKNVEEASKWPATYAELSKSGGGVHLHYIYTGDVSRLSRVYDDHIEVKVFNGKSSLRRKLVKCNNLPIATISSGLPLKGDKQLVNFDAIKSEKGLRTLIKRNLNKEIHPGTKPSIDFIHKILEDAYNDGLRYDISDMKNAVLAFAANSTNQAEYCIKRVGDMKFKSEEPSIAGKSEDDQLVFYDVEVFPNLFLVNWKVEGEGKPVVRMINPTPSEIENIMRFNLVGFNCRRYDNHMLYARLMGYTNEQLYKLSQRIINGDRNAFFGEAYNVSYTDIYDFASAGNKMGLKKLEIEMSNKANDPTSKMDDELRKMLKSIKHQELGLPWDQPVPEELWPKVAEYCDNDVIATEAAFYYLSADWTARQILSDLADMTVNDATNSLTTRIIFGNNRKPQGAFNYRDLSQPVYELDSETKIFLKDACPEMMAAPHGKAKSLLPYFEGYKYDRGKSTYRGEEVGEGGFVYAEPGIHTNVALLDIASMHPHSAIAEVLFGVEFTRRFKEIVDGRVDIKHEAWDAVNNMLDGKLTPYIQKVINGEMTSKQLADALKTAINAVYGQTFAGYDNPFKDRRNKDNIVAKRGALFMVDLKNAVQEKGFTVAHIKTDSIKIPNATPEIIHFVMDFGKRYGYTFEHEATYEKMCLVNDAVYIAKYKDGEWTATGTQFAVPYVFKKLFSKEPIVFEDMCETKQVSTSLYLDMNENKPDVTMHETLFDIRMKEADPDAKELTKKEQSILDKFSFMTPEELTATIEKGHEYCFVGRVGQFCPIKEGRGGGVLCRESKDKYGNTKYAAPSGSKGYRWLESEMVKQLGKEDDIDRSFYDKLVDDAAEAIAQYGDLEWFISDDSDEPETPPCLETPPWVMECGAETCEGCKHFVNDENGMKCTANYDISDLVTLNKNN